MRTVDSFTNFAHRYAAARGGPRTNVTFGGTIAFTDGRRINLPALPAGTMLTPWQTRVYSGYLDHEIAHLRYTDFTKMGIDRRKEPTKFYLLNLLEDIRIENRMITDFPGTREYLDACTQQIEYDKRENKEYKPTAGILLLEAIYKKAYRDYRGCAEIKFLEQSELEQYPAGPAIADAMKEIPSLRNVSDSERLARKIFDLLPKNQDYSKPVKEENGPKGQIFILVPGPGRGSGADNNGLDDAAVIIIGTSDKGEGMKALIEDLDAGDGRASSKKPHQAQRRWGNAILPPCGTDKDRIFTPSPRDQASFEAVRSRVAADIASVKQMLRIFLQSRTKSAWERGLPEGTLDADALPSLFAGNRSVFKARRNRTLINTAVQVMVDLSGSMSQELTQQAAIMLAEALAGIPKIALSIAGFTTNDHKYKGAKSGGRMDALDVLLFKDFREPYHSAASRLGALRTYGLTPLGEAYALGYQRLRPRPEAKRVLWVITDGDPYFHCKDDSHNEFLLMNRIHRHCKKHRIQVVGMNIGRINPQTTENFDLSYPVNRSNELAGAMLQTMREIVEWE